MRTDIRSPSESEEFAELAISALMKALMTALHWHVDINIVLSANEVRADVLPFIHALGGRSTYDAGVRVEEKVAPCRPKITVVFFSHGVVQNLGLCTLYVKKL